MPIDVKSIEDLARDKVPLIDAEIAELEGRLAELRQIRRGLALIIGDRGDRRTPNMEAADERGGLSPKQIELLDVMNAEGLDPLQPLPRGARKILRERTGVASDASLTNHLGAIKMWARARRMP